MKVQFGRFFLVFAFLFIFPKIYSQPLLYQGYILNLNKIEGFRSVSIDSIPENVRHKLSKECKKMLSGKNDSVFISVNSSGSVCASFISKNFEASYIIADSTGNKLQTITCLNPEFTEYDNIYEQVIETSFSFCYYEWPYSAIHKNITPSNTWYEAFVKEHEDEECESVLIFNKQFKQVATEIIQTF